MRLLRVKTSSITIILVLALCISGCHNRRQVKTEQSSTSEAPAPAIRPEDFKPGDEVPADVIVQCGADAFFRDDAISDATFALMQGRSYKEGCPVPREDLRYLTVLHKDSLGRSLVGEIIVNKDISQDILQIMQALYEASYPIEKMRLIDYYDADDHASMLDNNSSAFNYRPRAHQSAISKHALGLAIDINPLYNPYCLTTESGAFIIEPKEARQYANRNFESPYKIEKGDACWTLFREHGFWWGGGWAGRTRDYQHFEK